MRLSQLFKRIAVVVIGCATIAILSGATFERVFRERAARDIAMPGRLVDIGGRRIHIDCRGKGSPTVVFESGLDTYGSLSWTAVHDSIARTTRACAYSRAGIMWSDPSARPFDADSSASDLHAALVKSGESAPWVMVGHSLGGSYITVFTSRYPNEVAGLVMVDASHPDQFAQYEKAVGRSIVPPPAIPRVGATLAWTGLVRLIPQPAAPASWPAVMTKAGAAYLPLSVQGLANEVEAVEATLARTARSTSLGDRPLIVLTKAAQPDSGELQAVGLTADQGARVGAVHRLLGDHMATWSARGRHVLVDHVSHYVHIDRPGVVIDAVRDVVGYVMAHDANPRRR